MLNNRLGRAELLKRKETLLATMTAALHAAKGQFDTAARTVAVDEHLPAVQALRHALLTAAVLSPDA